jgi:hypothetical protein
MLGKQKFNRQNQELSLTPGPVRDCCNIACCIAHAARISLGRCLRFRVGLLLIQLEATCLTDRAQKRLRECSASLMRSRVNDAAAANSIVSRASCDVCVSAYCLSAPHVCVVVSVCVCVSNVLPALFMFACNVCLGCCVVLVGLMA